MDNIVHIHGLMDSSARPWIHALNSEPISVPKKFLGSIQVLLAYTHFGPIGGPIAISDLVGIDHCCPVLRSQ